jgi:hypothetical protein
VPDAGLDVDPEHLAAGPHIDPVDDLAGIVEPHQPHGSADHHEGLGLGRVQMAVGPGVAAWLHDVEHPLQGRIVALVQPLNDAATRAGARQGGGLVQHLRCQRDQLGLRGLDGHGKPLVVHGDTILGRGPGLPTVTGRCG